MIVECKKCKTKNKIDKIEPKKTYKCGKCGAILDDKRIVYYQALTVMENNPKDFLEDSDKVLPILTGALGYAAAPTIAGIFGANTLLGSTFLGSLLGGVFVTTTPIGWVVGSTAAAAVLTYAGLKIFKSGVKNSIKNEMRIQEIKKKIEELEKKANKTNKKEEKFQQLIKMYKILLDKGFLSEKDMESIFKSIKENKINIDEAFKAAKKLLDEIDKT
jgi:transcription initiation factor TFIIIB Brf1 subunit/transcription initiation factor TFIIB